MGSDVGTLRPTAIFADFNPRSPCGERPDGGGGIGGTGEFQSTLPVWGATPRFRPVSGRLSISIHAPRVGSATSFTTSALAASVFQSTLPVWGATRDLHGIILLALISIHAPRVGSDFISPQTEYTITISIHAPRVGSDCLRRYQRQDSGISIHAPRVGSDQAGY